MQRFRILCFSNGLLEAWEELEADDVVQAVRCVSVPERCQRVELWRGDQRVAVLKQAGTGEGGSGALHLRRGPPEPPSAQ